MAFRQTAPRENCWGARKERACPFKDRVPRHLISTFTGDVSVIATLSVTENDKRRIAQYVLSSLGLTVDVKTFPSEVVFERQQRFKDGDFSKTFFSLLSTIRVKGSSQRAWRAPTEAGIPKLRIVAIYGFTPDIAYFPTFVFDFPEAIFLTDRGGVIDGFYRRVFQDILDFDKRGHTIEKDIIRRVGAKVCSFLAVISLDMESTR